MGEFKKQKRISDLSLLSRKHIRLSEFENAGNVFFLGKDPYTCSLHEGLVRLTVTVLVSS